MKTHEGAPGRGPNALSTASKATPADADSFMGGEVADLIRSGDFDQEVMHCPAHDDHNPSLVITATDDRTLIHCRAGCATGDVLTAAGLSMADLYPADADGPGEPPAWAAEPYPARTAYDWPNEAGKVLYQTRRFPGPDGKKRFKVLQPDGTPGLNGARRVLYRLPEVVAAVAEGREVHLAEGEKDADALTLAGCTATTNLGGAANWRDEYADSLKGASMVTVWRDRDTAGATWAAKVAASLAARGIPHRVVMSRVEDEKADAYDHLAAGWGVHQAVPVEAAPQAPPRTVDGWSFLAPGEPDEPPLWGHADVAALWPSGESLFVFGPPGTGKSTLAQLIVFSRLGLRPDVLGFPVTDDGRKVLYLAMDRPRQIKRAMRRLVRLDHEQTLRERLIVHQGPLDFDMIDPKERDRLRDWALSLGIGTVVVDSIKDVMPEVEPKLAGYYNQARQALLAAGIELIELHHNRKAQSGNTQPNKLDDVYGGRWITAGAGSVISLWQDEPGSPVISMRHIRTSGELLRDTTLILDPATGELETEQALTLDDVIAAHPDGFTVAEAAAALHPGKVTKGQREAIRGRLKRMAARGALETDPFTDSADTRYRAAT